MMKPRFQGWPGDIFLRQKMNAVHAGNLINLHDIPMHKRSSQLRFLRKAIDGVGMPHGFLSQDLDRYLPAKRLLRCQIDVGHRATSKPTQQTVSSQLLTGEIVVVRSQRVRCERWVRLHRTLSIDSSQQTGKLFA